MLIKILLFVLYPAVMFFLINNDIKSLLTYYCFAVILFVIIEKNKKNEAVLLDTSVINDDRVIDIIDSSLFQRILLPRFVIREIETRLDTAKDKHLEDNLNKIKQNKNVKILYTKISYNKIKTSDFKIITLAKSLKVKILTTNFTLNKMALIQGVKVIDINDLYERLKPVVLPGCKISVFLVKEGKERNQAIGFLDDGSTVVAENGRNFVGKRMNLKITSLLHTSSNKMLFGKILNEDIIEDDIKK